MSKLMAAHESNREKYQRNLTNRKDLEQRVSNGDKLDTADDAMLSKLTAEHESKKRDINNQQRRARKSWSDAKDLKLVKLVGESNSTIKPNGPSYHAVWETTHRGNAAHAATIA